MWHKHWMEVRFLAYLSFGVAFFCALWLDFGATAALPGLVTHVDPVVNATPQEAEHRAYLAFLFRKALLIHAPIAFMLLAVTLGLAGIGVESGRGIATFSLSLPVTRQALIDSRFASSALVLFACSFTPGAMLAISQSLRGSEWRFTYADSLGIGVCLFVGSVGICALSFAISNLTGSAVLGLTGSFLIVAFVMLAAESPVAPLPSSTAGATPFFSWFDPLRLMGASDFVLSGRLPVPRIAAMLVQIGMVYLLTRRALVRMDL